jgi:hypothetical protein
LWTYLLFWREVVDYIEQLADLFWWLALDHVCDSFTANIPADRGISIKKITGHINYKCLVAPHAHICQTIARQPRAGRPQSGDENLNLQEGFDIKVICSKDNLKEHLLVDGDKFLIPLANVCGAFARFVRWGLIAGGEGLCLMVIAILKDLRGGNLEKNIR